MSFSLSEYTKIDVGWSFAPDPTRPAYSSPPGPLLDSRGPLRSRREGREGLGEGNRGRDGNWGMGKRGENGEIGGNSALVVGG